VGWAARPLRRRSRFSPARHESVPPTRAIQYTTGNPTANRGGRSRRSGVLRRSVHALWRE
jgi:hypothetical protein